MRVLAEPPINTWRVDRRNGGVIATGHQPWLWHPGIFAKDMAMVSVAKRLGMACFHLVVDHDTVDPLRLQLPVRAGDRLEIEAAAIDGLPQGLPTCAYPGAGGQTWARSLRAIRERLGERLLVDLDPLIRATERLTHHPDAPIAVEVTSWVEELWRPYIGNVPIQFSSKLFLSPLFADLKARLLGDARRCVECYNRAARAHPESGIAELIVELDRVELPLWSLHAMKPRARVYADLSDQRAVLTAESGEPLADPVWLAPRALLMTAMVRSKLCDLFIHGTGGGVYDRVTEDWWREWTGEELAPMAVVTADLTLSLDVPVAEPRDMERAVWWAHHVPHNVDRTLEPSPFLGRGQGEGLISSECEAKSEDPHPGPLPKKGEGGTAYRLIKRKHELLTHMDNDRDARRRAAAFAELHRINDELTKAHPQLIADAAAAVERTRVGLANRAIAQKRDWCFALYPPEQLRELAAAFDLQSSP